MLPDRFASAPPKGSVMGVAVFGRERPGAPSAGANGPYCMLPFSEISVFEDGRVYPNCCPDWLKFPLGNLLEQSWSEVWNGKAARRLRQSMLDGNAKYCDADWCPHLQSHRRGAEDHRVVPVSLRPKGERWDRPIDVPGPLAVGMHYDASCNLACPTCRAGVEAAVGEAAERVRRIHEVVERDVLPSATQINLTGTGDPFASAFLRKFLVEFDRAKYPQLENVHLHTNAILWTEAMWAKMPGLHEMSVSTDISIDASTKETYEVVRLPARWEVLQENLRFIMGLPNVHSVGISMTVSRLNFRELVSFHDLGVQLADMAPDKYVFVEYKRARRRGHHKRRDWKTLGIEHLDVQERAELAEQLAVLRELRTSGSMDVRSNLDEFSAEQLV